MGTNLLRKKKKKQRKSVIQYGDFQYTVKISPIHPEHYRREILPEVEWIWGNTTLTLLHPAVLNQQHTLITVKSQVIEPDRVRISTSKT